MIQIWVRRTIIEEEKNNDDIYLPNSEVHSLIGVFDRTEAQKIITLANEKAAFYYINNKIKNKESPKINFYISDGDTEHCIIIEEPWETYLLRHPGFKATDTPNQHIFEICYDSIEATKIYENYINMYKSTNCKVIYKVQLPTRIVQNSIPKIINDMLFGAPLNDENVDDENAEELQHIRFSIQLYLVRNLVNTLNGSLQ
jgi:hypothetical protein